MFSTRVISRFGSWLFGKARTSNSEGLVEQDEEVCILESTFEDVSYPLLNSIVFSSPAIVNMQTLTQQNPPLNPGAGLTTLPQHSPLALLELSLLCSAQGITVIPVEPQTAVLRSSVAASQALIVEVDETIPAEAQIITPTTPTISITPPTPNKNPDKALSKPITLLRLQNVTGTLRPSGNWDGKKKSSRRRAHDKENRTPTPSTLKHTSRPLKRTPTLSALKHTSRPLKTREERLKEYTPAAHLLGLRTVHSKSVRHAPEDSLRSPTPHTRF